MYGCESGTVKKAEPWRIGAFELWCWRRLLRVPWTARRSNQSILKEISPGRSLEGLMLKVKLQYFGHLMKELTHWKRLWCWEGLGAWGEWEDRNDMAEWHHWHDGHEFEWTPGVGDGQGGLACCDSWGRRESDTTKRLNWNCNPKFRVHWKGGWAWSAWRGLRWSPGPMNSFFNSTYQAYLIRFFFYLEKLVFYGSVWKTEEWHEQWSQWYSKTSSIHRQTKEGSNRKGPYKGPVKCG